ncbi:hypothetical protein SLE2022_119820 [Rubroshorea leprosula]
MFILEFIDDSEEYTLFIMYFRRDSTLLTAIAAMLYKILNVHKLVSLRHGVQPKPVAPPPPQMEEEMEEAEPSSAALRIVHVGGTVEYYYMAIPAA